MAVKTQAELLAYFATNGARLISGAKLQDFVDSLFNFAPPSALIWPQDRRVVSGAITYYTYTDALYDAADSVQLSANYMDTWTQQTGTNGNSWSSTITLRAGTYTFFALCGVSTDRGKVDFSIDGAAAFTTFDLYRAAGIRWLKKIQTNVTVNDGRRKITATVNGKNASSTGYWAPIGLCGFVPATD